MYRDVKKDVRSDDEEEEEEDEQEHKRKKHGDERIGGVEKVEAGKEEAVANGRAEGKMNGHTGRRVKASKGAAADGASSVDAFEERERKKQR